MTRRAAAGGFRIGTRGSDVALRRAKSVLEPLRERGIEAELVVVKTAGEKKLDEQIGSLFVVGRFTDELDAALRAEKIDCYVCGMDELAAKPDAELDVAAILARDDPRDVLVVNDLIAAESIDDLPRGSRVGAASVRRRAQLLHLRSDLELVELRGDAATRLRKVDDGQAHAAIFAAASLVRLDVHQRIDAWLEPPDWLPAAGQGAVGLRIRRADDATRTLLASLDHEPTSIAVRAERALQGALADGLQVPIAALTMTDGAALTLHALVADTRGRRILRGSARVDAHAPEHSGTRLALDLLDRGAADLLASLRKVDRVPTPQPE